jgi:hypothetical protein
MFENTHPQGAYFHLQLYNKIMSKKTKRRDKPYTGADAKNQQPTVHHYSAVLRSPLGEWWHDHKRIIKLVSGISAGVLFVGWLLLEGIHLLLFKTAF